MVGTQFTPQQGGCDGNGRSGVRKGSQTSSLYSPGGRGSLPLGDISVVLAFPGPARQLLEDPCRAPPRRIPEACTVPCVVDVGRELSLKCHSGSEACFSEFSQACLFCPERQASSCNKQSGAVPKPQDSAPSVGPLHVTSNRVRYPNPRPRVRPAGLPGPRPRSSALALRQGPITLGIKKNELHTLCQGWSIILTYIYQVYIYSLPVLWDVACPLVASVFLTAHPGSASFVSLLNLDNCSVPFALVSILETGQQFRSPSHVPILGLLGLQDTPSEPPMSCPLSQDRLLPWESPAGGQGGGRKQPGRAPSPLLQWRAETGFAGRGGPSPGTPGVAVRNPPAAASVPSQ